MKTFSVCRWPVASDGETTFANEELSKKIALYYHSLVSLITINTV
jgi:hypothetical protein